MVVRDENSIEEDEKYKYTVIISIKEINIV